MPNLQNTAAVQTVLREKDERLRAALTASGTGTFRWNIQTNALEWDESLDALFGLPPGQTVRSLENFIATVHPDDRQGVIDRCRRCAERGADFEMEFRVIWPDGTEHWLYDKGKTFFDEAGRPLYMTGACLDITERKQAHEALRESERKYRSIFESIDEGFYIAELIYDDQGRAVDHRLLEVNEAFTRQTGYVNATGKTASELVPDMDSQAVDVYDRVAKTGQPMRFERIHRSTGQIFDVCCSRLGERGDHRIAVVFNNITDRRRAEEALRRSDQLAAAGRMAAVVAHEINNPLEAVVNLCYLMENQEMSSAAREYLATAQMELSRVMHIAKQTLSFYRANSRSSAVNVTAVVQDAIKFAQQQQGSRPVAFTLSLAENVYASAHDNELRQVVLNLLMNAMEADCTRIAISVRQSKDWGNFSRRGARITIRDNGNGIPADRRPFIFEPFYTTKETKGTGLGLWVSQSIVVKHGGSIRLRSSSKPGRFGTCFSIFIPATATSSASAKTA